MTDQRICEEEHGQWDPDGFTRFHLSDYEKVTFGISVIYVSMYVRTYMSLANTWNSGSILFKFDIQEFIRPWSVPGDCEPF
jgi:hypothetical protein